MTTLRLKGVRVAALAGSALLGGILPGQAQSRHDYPEEGTVISATIEYGHVYTIETDDKVLQGLCVSLNPFRQTPVCKTGGRPITVRDRIHFRRDGDMAYLPETGTGTGTGTGEERLVILSTETKLMPPLPATAALAPESGAVLGLGIQTRLSSRPASASSPIQSSASPSASSSSTPAGPVIAVPVTGGPPVPMIPTSPAGGGVITGIPVTGGPPVAAIPVTPVAGNSAGATSASAVASAPMPPAPQAPGKQWVHFARVQTASHVYDLACPSKSCSLEHNPIQLGDLITLRLEKKSAYLSRANSGANHEQKFEILAVRSIDEPPGVPPH